MKKELAQRIKNLKRDIESIKIQGASNVAFATVNIILLYLRSLKNENDLEIARNKLYEFMDEVSVLRKTEPLSRNLVKYLKYKINKKKIKTVTEFKKYIKLYSQEYSDLLDKHKKQIAKHGAKLIKKDDNIFTHCHSSMVEEILKTAFKKRKFNVFNDETRPLLQGHITSNHLLEAGIPDTIVVDSASAFLISKYSGKELSIDKIFLGTDAIALDGSCVNKIGSYGISLSAHTEKIDLYIASSLLKIDIDSLAGEEIQIEERSASELWSNPPKGLKVINLAFDLIPKKHIRAYITEFGLIEAKNIKKIVKEKYPWLFLV